MEKNGPNGASAAISATNPAIWRKIAPTLTQVISEPLLIHVWYVIIVTRLVTWLVTAKANVELEVLATIAISLVIWPVIALLLVRVLVLSGLATNVEDSDILRGTATMSAWDRLNVIRNSS